MSHQWRGVIEEYRDRLDLPAGTPTITLGEGVVYPILHSLEERSCLRARSKPVNGRTRVYYSTTAEGRKRLSAMIGEWKRISSAVSSVVGGRTRANAAV